LKHFQGIDNFLEQKRTEFAKVNDPDRFQSGFIKEKKYEIEQEIINDRKERGQKALEEIAQIKESLNTKTFKSPYSEIATTEDKLLAEMQQARDADILKAKLKLATTSNDITALYDKYGDYEYFNDIITLDLQARQNNDEAQRALSEINKEPEGLLELKQLESTVKFLSNNNYHPNGLEKNLDPKEISFEPMLDKQIIKF